MSATTSLTETAEPTEALRLTTEAASLCGLLGDMDVTLGVDLSGERLFATIGEYAGAGAIDVLKIVTKRFEDDPAFREDLVCEVSHSGYYITEAPGYDARLPDAPAASLIQALAKSGLLIRHHYERNDELTPMLSFMPVPGRAIGSNAHLLMKLMIHRFTEQPEFAKVMTQFLVAQGQSQHSA